MIFIFGEHVFLEGKRTIRESLAGLLKGYQVRDYIYPLKHIPGLFLQTYQMDFLSLADQVKHAFNKWHLGDQDPEYQL